MQAFRPALKPLALAVALATPAGAYAFQTEFEGGATFSLDTTLSYGVSVRAKDRDAALIAITNGGTSRDPNSDNGDLNFDKNKPFANVVKASMEAEAKWRNFGFFGRGYAFYDFTLHDSDKLGPTGQDRLGKNVVGLDGFVSASFQPAGRNLNIRAGRQVINWGESTFIFNGIAVVSPLDVSRLRSPGAEIKEALLPTTGLWASQEITKAVSVEGFYLTNWDKVRLDPMGSYFSNTDSLSDDATRATLSFGRRKDEHFPPSNPVPPGIPGLSATAAALYGPFDPAASLWIPRSADRNPSDHGQWGAAFRYFAQEFNNTEFGFYAMNYHSRTPIYSGVRGGSTSILTGGPLITPICGVPALAGLCATGTGYYFAEYPENIKLYGLSFNSAGPWNIALQGEYSYRPNQPIQLATQEVTVALLGGANEITGATQIPGAPAGATAAALVPIGTEISGYRRVKMSQLQFTGTKAVPTVMGSDQLVVVSEVGMTYLHNLPTDLHFAGPGAGLPVTPFGALQFSGGSQQTEGFTTSFSWGYRIAARLEYANALFGGSVSPRVAWAHDVKGVSPTFNEGVKSYSLGVAWDYQRKWVVDLQYTGFMGGRTYCGTDPQGAPAGSGQSADWCTSANPLKDRDFYSVSVSYSF